uniref:hypothetical protein n=1 Tax=Aneurinibacillus tyrosinisolvens TaxID=1443435 RepID=UPI000A8FD71F
FITRDAMDEDNLYLYTSNNPVMYTDPDGYMKENPNFTVVKIITAAGLVVKIARDEAQALMKSAGKKMLSYGKTILSKGTNNSKIFWGSWSDYKKVTVNGQTYAKVGNRLYSKHAVDRMQPSGNRYGSQITQAGGDYGRSVSPTYVENVIKSTKPVVQQNGNLSYKSGTLQVITNKQGAVVTIITR